MKYLKTFCISFLFVYLLIGGLHAAIPAMVGAWQVALKMLVWWPAVHF